MTFKEGNSHALLACIIQAQGLRDTLPPSDKALSRLLAEAPVLPDTALELLEGLCRPQPIAKEGKEASTGDRITQGLSAIWSLILVRPPVRDSCLTMALQVNSSYSGSPGSVVG